MALVTKNICYNQKIKRKDCRNSKKRKDYQFTERFNQQNFTSA
jgi:hypothetical protein